MKYLVDANRYRDNIALIDNTGKSLTYQQLQKKVLSLGEGLGQGLALLECLNEVDAIAFYLAALEKGCPIILVNPQDKKNIKTIYERYPIRYHFYKADHQWQLKSNPAQEIAQYHQDLAAILSTSGSTGNSKQIKLSLSNLTSNADSIVEYLNINEHDRTITTLPFNYSYGLSVINSHLRAGASIVLNDLSVTEKQFWHVFEEQKCCSFAGVPHTYELLLRSDFVDSNLPSLRYFTQAGGKLPADKVAQIQQLAKEKGADFYVMYGQTEATARMAYLPPSHAAEKPGSIGIAIPGGELSLIDEEGQAISDPYTEGELIYKGPNIMMGYATNLKDLTTDESQAYLRTGDLAQFDSDGYFSITGRLNRFVKPFGIRIGLDELENSLAQEGLHCTCTGTDDQLMLAITEGHSADKIQQRVVELTHLPNSLVNVQPIEEIPRLSNGKINYPALISFFEESTNSLSVDNSQKSAKDQLVQVFKSRLNIRDVPLNANFRELGGDSLTYVQVSMDLEKILGHLPNNWENTPLIELANKASTSKSSKHWSRLDSSSVIRAWSVSAVVMNHAGLSFLAGGAALLLLVSGLNLARFQWASILEGNFSGFLRSMFLNVLLPYWGLLIAFPLLKGGSVDIHALLLVANMFRIETDSGFPAWFIAALVQCLLLTFLPLTIPMVRHWVKSNEFLYALILVAISIVARLLDGYFQWGENLGTLGRQITWVFWLFTVGFAAFFAETTPKKILISTLIIALPTLFFSGDFPRIFTISIGGLFLVWYSSIPLPALLKKPIAIIGSASLFIYLLHSRAPIMLIPSLPVDIPRIVIGISMGIIGWKLYDIGINYAFRKWNRGSHLAKPS